MAERYTLLDLAEEVLRQSDRPLSAAEIWKKGKELGLHDKLTNEIKGKTPWSTFGSKIYGDMERNGESSKWIKVGRGRFSLREKMPEPPNSEAKKPKKRETNERELSGNWKEKDLHPLLAHFAFNSHVFEGEKNVITKTIKHEISKSKRKGLSEWLYPDMVGAYIPPKQSWNDRIMQLAPVLNGNLVKLYSFELKTKLIRGNYREAFFQAVSNSSWAHEGYLVASEIESARDFRSEIERLALSFGIGIIHLDLRTFGNSSVLYPSTTKPNLDWETMNKLCSENPDFENFIVNIHISVEKRKTFTAEFDTLIDSPDEHIRKMMTKH